MGEKNGEEKNESYAKKRAVKRNCIDNYWRNIFGDLQVFADSICLKSGD